MQRMPIEHEGREEREKREEREERLWQVGMLVVGWVAPAAVILLMVCVTIIVMCNCHKRNKKKQTLRGTDRVITDSRIADERFNGEDHYAEVSDEESVVLLDASAEYIKNEQHTNSDSAQVVLRAPLALTHLPQTKAEAPAEWPTERPCCNVLPCNDDSTKATAHDNLLGSHHQAQITELHSAMHGQPQGVWLSAAGLGAYAAQTSNVKLPVAPRAGELLALVHGDEI